MSYDLVIIGGGPAGVSAGVYAARKKIKTVLITDNFGGQSLVSADIQNWIGTKSVSGFDLAKMFEEHLRIQEDIEIVEGDKISKISKTKSGFELKTENGKTLESKTVLVTTGSRYKKLNVPGERDFEGKGISNCSTCDAPVFKGKDVAVIGGGNSGLEAVLDLIPYANKIYLFHRRESLKGDSLTQEKIKANPKVQIILNSETKEFFGGDLLGGLRYLDNKSGKPEELKVEGAFVKVGLVPNTDFVKDLVKLGKWGEIVVDHKTQKSSLEGIWAAGDASDV
ncbi:MAG: FAD-dependent oxidoreductase, partial [Patescibacteria group bacterium]